MKRCIYILLALLVVSCEKSIGLIPPLPLPPLPIVCEYEGVEYDHINRDIVLSSDGGELIFEVKDECAPAYFREYYLRYDDNKFDRVLVQYHKYEGIDNYECDLFELKQIDEYRFHVRILPSEQYVKIQFIFNPQGTPPYYNYAWGKLAVIVNGQ